MSHVFIWGDPSLDMSECIGSEFLCDVDQL